MVTVVWCGVAVVYVGVAMGVAVSVVVGSGGGMELRRSLSGGVLEGAEVRLRGRKHVCSSLVAEGEVADG